MSYKKELEACVQMRVYAFTKRQFFILGILVFAIFALSVFVGIFGPNVLDTKQFTYSPKQIPRGPFVIEQTKFTIFQQDLWIYAKFFTHDTPKHISEIINYQIIVNSTSFDRITHTKDKESRTFSKNITLDCTPKSCLDLMLFHITPLNNTEYVFEISFKSLQAVHNVRDVQLFMQTYDQKFTYFEIISRLICLVVSFILSVVFLRCMRAFKFRDWTIEQKWLALLLPLLLLYNNPFNPMKFLILNSVPRIFDVVFNVTFICALLLFWLSVYHGIRVDKRTFCLFYLNKCIVVGIIWLLIITCTSYKVLKELDDPLYDIMNDTKSTGSIILESILAIISVIYLFYITLLMMRAFGELKKLPYFNIRLSVFTVMACCVFIVCLAIFVIRYGENFLSLTPGGEASYFTSSTSQTSNKEEMENNGFRPSYRSAAEISVFYAILNTYILLMVILYSPSKNALIDAHFGDDPSISMLNDDSDEDVVYDSELEDNEERSHNYSKQKMMKSGSGAKYSFIGKSR